MGYSLHSFPKDKTLRWKCSQMSEEQLGWSFVKFSFVFNAILGKTVLQQKVFDFMKL